MKIPDGAWHPLDGPLGPMPANLRRLVEGDYFPTAYAGVFATSTYRRRERELRAADCPVTAAMLDRARHAELLDPEPDE